MADLRLIGVHEDGAHLILADPDGVRHRLPLDDALRAAARRDRPRLGQLLIEIDGGLRPRDVQALLRSGASVEETAERAGWTVEKVDKYAGPILAEREHIASVARAVRLRTPRGAAGPTLLSRVEERLTARGVDASSAEWDSWRRESTEWVLVLSFAAGGRQRTASWSYNARTRSLAARDDEARWLSEDEPGQNHSDVPVYDVEAEGGLEAPARRRETSPHDLTTAMRQASGAKLRRAPARRRGTEPMALPIDAASSAESEVAQDDAAASDAGADLGGPATVVHLDSRRDFGRGRLEADEDDRPAAPGEFDTAQLRGDLGDLEAAAVDDPREPPNHPDGNDSADDDGTPDEPEQQPEQNDESEQDSRSAISAPKLTAAERRSALAQERLKSTWDSFLFGPARGSGAQADSVSDAPD
ncbi:MAG: DUF3071 domain-containing protein [Actinomycetales bacterium]|nr:DUF3071 domain-containing protein [Actinomycetales bacterium]